MLFKFTAVKPPATKIWEKVYRLDLEPIDGYSTNQIKYMLFVLLQFDFTKCKVTVNDYISHSNPTTNPLTAQLARLQIQKENIARIKSIEDNFPHMIDESLYLPYYYTMQLNSKSLIFQLMKDLFDRKTIDEKETNYINYCIIDNPELAITRYNWYMDKIKYNDYIVNYYNSIFRIDNTMTPVVITNKQDLYNELYKYVKWQLDFEPYYDNYNAYIRIPPFKLEEKQDET
ncbi:MAG: hypothetical protein WC179_05065 [Candidatus Cloacimonadaceae bacterium]